MQKEIIQKAFDKAKEESGLELITPLSVHISDALLESHKFLLSAKTLRNRYNEILNDVEAIKLSPKIANALCQYLGYKDLKDYLKQTTQKGKKKLGTVITKEKALMGSLIVIASYFGFDYFDKKCMVWVEDHYEKAYCEKANTIAVNENLVIKFKKTTPDCEYPFFNADDTANLWYGKSVEGEYEYFLYLAKHPITKKALKEITPYMIKKYICPTYPNS